MSDEIERIAREAFKEGWHMRNKNPGLKRRIRRTLNNAIMSSIGGGRYMDADYVPDVQKYSHSFWMRSAARAAILKAKGEA